MNILHNKSVELFYSYEIFSVFLWRKTFVHFLKEFLNVHEWVFESSYLRIINCQVGAIEKKCIIH